MRNRPDQHDVPTATSEWNEEPRDPSPKLGKLRRLGPTGLWPTLFTLGNLIAGFTAIYCATRPLDAAGFWGWTSLTMACALILLGMFLDSVDGSVARMTGGVTEIGGQLDALADLITFGVAPAFLMLHIVSNGLGLDDGASIFNPGTGNVIGRICWAIAALYVCCAALRLARFTVQTAAGQLGDHMTFIGLPSPGAAGLIASTVLLHQHLDKIQDPVGVVAGLIGFITILVPIFTFCVALLMISSIRYPHMANRFLRVNRSFGHTAWFAVAIIFLVVFFQETLAIIFFCYACSGPARVLLSRIRAFPGTPSTG
jgi:CDP-diacylglycerol--serine O-phosphatidyltransferase